MRMWSVVGLALAAQLAHADMWKCVDQDGNTRYTNVRSEAKGCQALHLDSPPVKPASKASPTVPATAKAQPQPQPKPANFPSVATDTQKQRDAGRRKILEQELAQEQQQLDLAKKRLVEQQATRAGSEKDLARAGERLKPYEDSVRLHETNVESLKKELASSR